MMDKVAQASSWVIALLLVGMLVMAYIAGSQKDEKLDLSMQVTKKQGEVERYKKLVDERSEEGSALSKMLENKGTQLVRANEVIEKIQQKMEHLKTLLEQKQSTHEPSQVQSSEVEVTLQPANNKVDATVARLESLREQLQMREHDLGIKHELVKSNWQALEQARDRETQLTQQLQDKDNALVQLQTQLQQAQIATKTAVNKREKVIAAKLDKQFQAQKHKIDQLTRLLKQAQVDNISVVPSVTKAQSVSTVVANDIDNRSLIALANTPLCSDEDSVEKMPLVVNVKNGANLRETNDTHGRRLTILPFGTKVKSLSRNNGWQKVKIEGYIFGKLVVSEDRFAQNTMATSQ